MSKLVVAVFEDENQAYKGSQAMLDLNRAGDIVVFTGAVITKNANGVVRTEDAVEQGPIGTGIGTVIGTLLGAFGGAAGMAAGATAGAAVAVTAAGLVGGAFSGWCSDVFNLGFDGKLLKDVGDSIKPGTSAVVAEVEQGSKRSLDVKMSELGGTVSVAILSNAPAERQKRKT